MKRILTTGLKRIFYSGISLRHTKDCIGFRWSRCLAYRAGYGAQSIGLKHNGIYNLKHVHHMFSEKQNTARLGGIVEVPLAQTGEGIAECELLQWYVQEGVQVEEFQPLCEVQSDKATLQITSRYRGKVSKVNFMPGDVIKVGETLLEIVLDDATSSLPCSSESDTDGLSDEENNQAGSSGQPKVLATPSVRHLAREHGINLAEVKGTGDNGRILKDDVLEYVAAKEGLEDELQALGDSLPLSDSLPGLSVNTSETATGPCAETTNNDRQIPVRGFQRVMARTMTAAAAIPHFHYMEEINMDAISKLKNCFQNETDIKLTYLPFLVKALSMALKRYPMLNSTVNEDASEICCKGSHNIGIAMAKENGLAVPNIKDVQKLSVMEVAKEIFRLSELAASNKLCPKDISGGTITVSNFGAIGGKCGSPILNAPEVAIVALGRIHTLPRFDKERAIYPASVMMITWGADHRVIDGATVARFCNEWKRLIEQPEHWILHLK